METNALTLQKIYFDMDGVLADFEGGVKMLTGQGFGQPGDRPTKQDEAMWAAIKEVPHFYDKLEPLVAGVTAFRAVRAKYGDKVEY